MAALNEAGRSKVCKSWALSWVSARPTSCSRVASRLRALLKFLQSLVWEKILEFMDQQAELQQLVHDILKEARQQGATKLR